jgi:2-keto-4-pentenoate hydratase/2-oxohepta-3-ene-1,7-dioic acid hydratase in catechol pathway
MKIVRFDDERVGYVDGRDVVDLTSVVPPSSTGLAGSPMRRLIAEYEQVRTEGCRRDLPRIALEETALRCPVPDPSKILAAPVNYVDHQREMSSASTVSELGLFLKSPASLLDPGGTVRLPYTDRRFDQEGELSVIIGRGASRIETEDEALNAVFGFTGALDMTMRGGEDRSTRKSFATFTPIGPWIVTADEFGDPSAVDLTCSVNGTVRQRANTRDLIWSASRLVMYASWISALLPGDILLTGTPAGVDEVIDGDEVVLELSGLGRPLAVQVTSAGAIPSHTSGHRSGPVPPASTRRPRHVS